MRNVMLETKLFQNSDFDSLQPLVAVKRYCRQEIEQPGTTKFANRFF